MKKQVEDVGGSLERTQEKESEVLEVEDHALLHIKRPGSSIVTFPEEISSKRQFRRYGSICGENGRRHDAADD